MWERFTRQGSALRRRARREFLDRVPKADTRRSRPLAALCLVAIAFAAACGGGDDSDGMGGFERYEEDGLAIEYPAAWTVDEGREGGEAGIRISVHGRRDEEGLYPRLSVARQEKEFVNAGQAGGAPRFSIEGDRGEKVPGRAVEVIALKEDEQFILTLAGPAERIERLPVERIVGSLDLN
jgi:hypothetical protein